MQTQEVTSFIKQFPANDQQAFQRLVGKLVFIPNAELHRFFRNTIIKILKKEKNKIAVFPLEKKFFRFNEEIIRDDTEFRKNYDSSSVIGRILHSIELELGSKRLLVSPTNKTLKAEKIKTYVFFDDLVGSGKRVNDFWVKFPSSHIRTLKSLMSLKKCNAYFVSYGMTSTGLESLQTQSKSKFKNIYYSRYSRNETDYLDLPSLRILKKYNPEGFGYRGNFMPIIFEHGCHNCLPSILWKKNQKWTPLFPSRSVPPYLSTYFNMKNKLFDQIATSLFDRNLTTISFILNEISDLNGYEKNYLIPILGLKTKGYSDKKIISLLLLELDIFEKCCIELKSLALLNNSHQLTNEGYDFLDNLSTKAKNELKNISGYEKNDIYLPSQFRGLKPII